MTSLRIGPLVRATYTTSAVIWVETVQPCTITLNVTSFDDPQEKAAGVTMRTVMVGGRSYAAMQLNGLQPATWYNYSLSTESDERSEQVVPYQCFRTLSSPTRTDSPPETPSHQPLRVAYGSCRKLTEPEKDTLPAFGSWLIERFEEREHLWPHLLLLIGDQIYADEPAPDIVKRHPHLKNGAQTFSDFASMYEYAWTSNEGVRQVLAVLPTFMIFDDHEVTNGWNISPTWRARALQRGLEQILVDGLIAYWIYQGWGNLSQSSPTQNVLLEIMQNAAKAGEDALEQLRACIRQEVYGETYLHWHYEISTTPPIFVADVRADRPALFSTRQSFTDAAARIMTEQQMNELRQWLYKNDSSVSLLVSSVPLLLPPLIGFAEYMMGIRPFSTRIMPLRWLGKLIGRIQQKLAVRTSFDHWPVFAATWHELVEALAKRKEDILVLSGDVHFSYAVEAHQKKARRAAKLYQFVCTPLQNVLGRKSRNMILQQARIKSATYGGLRTRMLPLHTAKDKGRIAHDMLLLNTLAIVTLEPQEMGKYTIRQDYLELREGKLQVIGYTVIEK
ncbi:MAG: alkaline phosphatase D family protein [Chloroflexota bacterium]|nr:alkaline phosphatase D family protein [Chloroflexota bacterium]